MSNSISATHSSSISGATPAAPTGADVRRPRISAKVWAGRVLSGFAVMFLAFDGLIKVLGLVPPEATTQLGYPADVIVPIGLIEIACLLVYLIPRTSVLGAILWTGYLGGAIATHVRIGSPLFTHMLFPIYVAALLWGGLFLRDHRVRALLRPRLAAS